MIELRGLSWGHRRATAPLVAAAADFSRHQPGIRVIWDVRPLSDFEHQGISAVARSYDLVVYDHPFSGDIAAARAFQPLDRHLPGGLGLGAGGRYIGPSLESYRYDGHVWGAPIDAATQHALIRHDLMEAAAEAVPTSWDDAIRLGRNLKRQGLMLGLAVVAPHALLVLAALMTNMGRPWGTDPAVPFALDADALGHALDLVAQLLAYCPPEARTWNAIDLHDAMIARDDIAYAPCAYGYATYGEPDMRRRLGFGPFAGAVAPYAAGSVLGGTALGLSSQSGASEAALAFIAHMLTGRVQESVIPMHHGQPALLSAWRRTEIDERFSGYFSGVRSSMEQAWIRPRMPGYIRFQERAGVVVADMLAGRTGRSEGIADVLRLASLVNTL